MTDEQKQAYFKRLNELKEAHKKAKQEKSPSINLGRLATLLSLAQHVGALKQKAVMMPQGLRHRQAWRAYYAMNRKLQNERKEYERWLAHSR